MAVGLSISSLFSVVFPKYIVIPFVNVSLVDSKAFTTIEGSACLCSYEMSPERIGRGALPDRPGQGIVRQPEALRLPLPGKVCI